MSASELHRRVSAVGLAAISEHRRLKGSWTIVRVQDWTGKPHGFQLETATGRVVGLYADDERSKADWVTTIQVRACAGGGGGGGGGW